MMYYEKESFSDVHIEPTNACNFRCWMCPRDAMVRPIGFMPLDKFKKMVADLWQADIVRHLHFGGFGEPTLHPDFLEMVQFVKAETGFIVSVTTNASMFGQDDFGRKILDTGIDKIIISFRHTTPEKIGQSLPNNLNYEQYVDDIVRLINIKISEEYFTEIDLAMLKDTLYSQFILNISASEFIDDKFLNQFLSKLSVDIGLPILSFTEFTASVKSHLERISVMHIAQGFKIRFDGLGAWTKSVEKYQMGDRCHLASYGSCLGLKTHFSIYCDGTVSTCCGDFNSKNAMGNIFDQRKNVREILSGSKALYFEGKLHQNKMPTKVCMVCRGGVSFKEKMANMVGTIFSKSASLKMYKKCLHDKVSGEK